MTQKAKTIQHEWSIISASSLVDQDTNNLSLINIIEEVSFEAQLKKDQSFDHEGEIIPLNMVISTRLRKLNETNETARGNIQIDFRDPKNKKMATFTQDFEMIPGVKNIRIRSGIAGLKVTQSGLYNFEILLKEIDAESYTKVYSLPLMMNLKISESV